MTAFTPEQEARIREIVGDVLIATERHKLWMRQEDAKQEFETALAWGLHKAGGGDD